MLSKWHLHRSVGNQMISTQHLLSRSCDHITSTHTMSSPKQFPKHLHHIVNWKNSINAGFKQSKTQGLKHMVHVLSECGQLSFTILILCSLNSSIWLHMSKCTNCTRKHWCTDYNISGRVEGLFFHGFYRSCLSYRSDTVERYWKLEETF